jgi:uncharacterized membrane protein YcaP (DUF421 family)
MAFWNDWWGINENISPLELSARAAVMFLVSLVLIRFSGMRPFGKGNTFDTIIAFLIGGILSRGIVGATPFLSCIAGAIVIILINKALAKLSVYNKSFERTVKGSRRILYADGRFREADMRQVSVSEADIYEELRTNCQLESLEKIKAVYIEKTGTLSFVKKES